jgi:hypothetical protein
MNKAVKHMGPEDLLMQELSNDDIERHALALAAKPNGVFFLAIVPTQNLDNDWNATALDGAEQGKDRWVRLVSRKKEGVDQYKVDYPKDADAFPLPDWPTDPLEDLILRAFEGRIADSADHPGVRRKTGRKQDLK